MAKLTAALRKRVTLTGLTEIMFDRYPGDNKTHLTPDQKFYLNERREICLPTINLMSFLSATNTESAPMVCLGKEARRVASAILCSTSILPSPLITLTRNKKPIVFDEFDEHDRDGVSGAYVLHGKAIIKKAGLAIPSPKSRPVLPLPWALEFDLQILPHQDLTENLIENLFADGGVRIGLGTFRKMFGKFEFAWK